MILAAEPHGIRRVFRNSRGFLAEAKAIVGNDVECWIDAIRCTPILYTVRAGKVWINSQTREGCLELCRDMVKAGAKGEA